MPKKKVCKDCCCPCNGLILLIIGVVWLLKVLEVSIFQKALVLPIVLILAGLYLKYYCKC